MDTATVSNLQAIVYVYIVLVLAGLYGFLIGQLSSWRLGRRETKALNGDGQQTTSLRPNDVMKNISSFYCCLAQEGGQICRHDGFDSSIVEQGKCIFFVQVYQRYTCIAFFMFYGFIG